MVDEKSSRNQAYVLLNVDYKHQKDIINKAKSLPAVTNVKVMYGIYDIMVILESNDTVSYTHLTLPTILLV